MTREEALKYVLKDYNKKIEKINSRLAEDYKNYKEEGKFLYFKNKKSFNDSVKRVRKLIKVISTLNDILEKEK